MNIAILGANGRMGGALLTTVEKDTETNIGAACVRDSSPLVDTHLISVFPTATSDSARNMTLSTIADIDESMDVVIDFTLPEALERHLVMCQEKQLPMVIGTTGLNEQQLTALSDAAKHIPIVFAANYSVGVTLMTTLCRIATRVLSESADIEIIEAHHRFKRDAPSGTALAIGQAIAEEANRSLETDAIYGREGDTGEREHNTIGFSTIRGGDIIGEHTALFADIGERVEITHKASSRETFAVGAVRAAKWLKGKPAGLYSMNDVLGLV